MINPNTKERLIKIINQELAKERQNPFNSTLEICQNVSLTFQNLSSSQMSHNFDLNLKRQRKDPFSQNNYNKPRLPKLRNNIKLSRATRKTTINLNTKPQPHFDAHARPTPNYLKKRDHFGNQQMPYFPNDDMFESVTSMAKSQSKYKKIDDQFEDLFSNKQSKMQQIRKSKLFKQEDFSTCSELNSLFNGSILSTNRLGKQLLDPKNQFNRKKNAQGQILSNVKMNTDQLVYSNVSVPEEQPEFQRSRELVLENSYFGDVAVEIREARKQEIRSLLMNLEKTFQYEKNSTITLKNLLKLDTLQIMIKPSIFKQLSFQMKIAFYMWYWFKLVDEKWFRKKFENFWPELNVQSIKFIANITKE